MDNDLVSHALEMHFNQKYRSAYYMTILYNENAKMAGRPLITFDPKNPTMPPPDDPRSEAADPET